MLICKKAKGSLEATHIHKHMCPAPQFSQFQYKWYEKAHSSKQLTLPISPGLGTRSAIFASVWPQNSFKRKACAHVSCFSVTYDDTLKVPMMDLEALGILILD